MGFLLTTILDDSFSWNDQVYHVDMAFDNILRMFEMFEDDQIPDIEKPFIAIQILVDENIQFRSYEETLTLFKYLLKEFINIDLDKEGEDEPNFFDFKKDAEIIYASFYSVYNIDLFEMQGKLHWIKFIALLSHLDDESKFKQVIGIRTMKIPKADESSQEYRDHIVKMKEIYTLDERSKEERVKDTLSDFAKILKANSIKES